MERPPSDDRGDIAPVVVDLVPKKARGTRPLTPVYCEIITDDGIELAYYILRREPSTTALIFARNLEPLTPNADEEIVLEFRDNIWLLQNENESNRAMVEMWNSTDRKYLLQKILDLAYRNFPQG